MLQRYEMESSVGAASKFPSASAYIEHPFRPTANQRGSAIGTGHQYSAPTELAAMRVSISINISLLRSAGRSAGEGQALTAKFLPALRAKPTLKTGQGISLPGSKCVVPDETKVFLWRGQRDPFNRRTDPQVSAANCAASLSSTSFRWRVSLDAMGAYEFLVPTHPATLCSAHHQSPT